MEKKQRIFVGGLSAHVTQRDLYQYFGTIGPVSSIRLLRDPATTKGKGYAFLQFKTPEATARALQSVHYIQGRLVDCQLAACSSEDKTSAKKNQISKRVFVLGVPLSFDEQGFADFFSGFGPIRMSYIIKCSRTSRSKQIGMVEYYSDIHASQVRSQCKLYISWGAPVFCVSLEVKNEVIHQVKKAVYEGQLAKVVENAFLKTGQAIPKKVHLQHFLSLNEENSNYRFAVGLNSSRQKSPVFKKKQLVLLSRCRPGYIFHKKLLAENHLHGIKLPNNRKLPTLHTQISFPEAMNRF